MAIAIDKKTSKLLKLLEKQFGCEVIKGAKNALFIRPPKGEQYLLHVGHKETEKSYHPLRRWANNTFNLKLQ